MSDSANFSFPHRTPVFTTVIVLGCFALFGWLVRKAYIPTAGAVDPVAGVKTPVERKALLTEPSVILLDEPTRGIDVGAKLEIYEIINKLTAAGKAVLLVSSELPELIGMSDRILMLREGRVGGEFTREEATQEKLMHAAMSA